jgi:hypothetical protein
MGAAVRYRLRLAVCLIINAHHVRRFGNIGHLYFAMASGKAP